MIKLINWPTLRLDAADKMRIFRGGTVLLTTIPIVNSLGSPEVALAKGEVMRLEDDCQADLGLHRVLDVSLKQVGSSDSWEVAFILVEEKDEEEGA